MTKAQVIEILEKHEGESGIYFEYMDNELEDMNNAIATEILALFEKPDPREQEMIDGFNMKPMPAAGGKITNVELCKCGCHLPLKDI